MKIVRLSLIFNLCVFISVFHGSVSAVETAPRISDREIIESLAEIKATQKNILQRFEQMDKRFDESRKDMISRFNKSRADMITRFAQVDKRLDESKADMITRFAKVNKRLDELRADMISRFDDANAANRLFFGSILSLLLALFGYIIWDRRTLLKPLEEKIIHVERELDIGTPDGSKISRLIETLRELSKEDDKVASALRQFHLL